MNACFPFYTGVRQVSGVVSILVSNSVITETKTTIIILFQYKVQFINI